MPALAVWLDLAKEFAVTGLSAFAGAWSAFLFERKREDKQDEDARYRAVRYAHFATLSQYAEMVSLSGVLAPFKGKDDTWRTLHPLLAQFTTPTIVASELAFVLESSDPDLLNRLTTGQRKFESVKGTLAFRNQSHLEFQSRMAGLLAQGVATIPDEDALQIVVGKDLVSGLKGATQALFEGVEDAAGFLKRNLDDLAAFSKGEFPKRRPPRYSLSESLPRI